MIPYIKTGPMMRHSKSLVRILRKTCGLTQAELAKILDCARLTVVELESGKLKLSQKIADTISLNTGVSKTWLLQSDPRAAPVCEKDPHRPYDKQVFEMTRAEVLDPRTEPADLAVIYGVLEAHCGQLRAVASEAYRKNEIIYFYYKTRQFFESLELRWPVPNQLGLTEAQFRQRIEMQSRAKATSTGSLDLMLST